MARPPPQTHSSRRFFPHTLRRYPARSLFALVVLAALWPFGQAQGQAESRAARSCDEWSGDVTAVEGLVEVRRVGTVDWVRLATGERVCSGDAVRSGSSSRATIVLPDLTTLRLDENSWLALPEPASGLGSLIELLRGVIHVISRDPRLLLFTTPYANAGLEGTEFDVRVDESARLTAVLVLEGEVVVTTPRGELNVGSDHIAIAREGEAPTTSPYADPIESMRWASYYPPLIDGPLPSPDQSPTPAQMRDPDFFAGRAAARLATARVEAAEADIAAALALAPRNATALSLNALLAVPRADRDTAGRLVAEALAAEPTSVVARLAAAHVERSSLRLSAARQVLREALTIEPDNSIVLTRLAEVALAEGDTKTAIADATRARSLAPTRSAPVVVLGFANYRAFDTAAAEAAFAAAVELEPQAPLPRLGLALVSIQRGDADAGRRQLELAVTLDPADPLTRSYVAKVYDALDRGDLTASQLDLAKEFDPFDPTPWVYSSLHKLRSNRPVEALHDLQAAAQKNGDRPIFHSWLPLDEDVATRSAGIGRVHNELGFGRLAQLDAWQAIADDPTNFAAHRLLADGYSTEPRHETPRVSELLVSQLLQPANVAPIKPQLAQQNLFIAQRAGPSHTSFDELTAPVLTNGLKLRASAVTGGNGAAGDDVALAGLHDRVSYSAGHYRFATDGFRGNNDLEQEIANLFVQYRPGHLTNLQAEFRSANMAHGDLATFFDRSAYSSLVRFDEKSDSLRLGAKHQFAPNHALLGSLIVQDVSANAAGGNTFGVEGRQEAYSIDVQDLWRAGQTAVQTGVVVAQQDETVDGRFLFPGPAPLLLALREKNRHVGLYSYATFNPTASLTLIAGGSIDGVEIGSVDDDTFNPKIGLVWRPTTQTTLRAAAFETVHHDLTTSQLNAQPRLEPVQVAGFTQGLLGSRGDESSVRGLAVDHELSRQLFVGWQAETRRTNGFGVDLFGALDGALRVSLRERMQHGYLYWMPLDQLSFSARYERSRYSSEPTSLFNYSHLKTARLPLEIRYFSRTGWTTGLRASHVHQQGTFLTPPTSPFDPPALTPGEDRFWVLDAFVGYRLPNRRGLLSLNADNLLDEQFQFQDIDPTNPSLFPERLVTFRFTLAFD